MEDQRGKALHWSNQKETTQAKSKDEVIGTNLCWICISVAPPLPSNPGRDRQVSVFQKTSILNKK